jgi:hypothetical protein
MWRSVTKGKGNKNVEETTTCKEVNTNRQRKRKAKICWQNNTDCFTRRLFSLLICTLHTLTGHSTNRIEYLYITNTPHITNLKLAPTHLNKYHQLTHSHTWSKTGIGLLLNKTNNNQLDKSQNNQMATHPLRSPPTNIPSCPNTWLISAMKTTSD